MGPVRQPAQAGRVGRSSWTRSCRRRETCGWPGSSSGSDLSGPDRSCGSGRGVDLIHLFIAGTRVKTVRSHLTVTDLALLVAQGAQNAGPSPLPPVQSR